MTHPLAAQVYVLRCKDCDSVHLFFADAEGVVIAEAVMIAPIAEAVARDINHFAAEHGGRVN